MKTLSLNENKTMTESSLKEVDEILLRADRSRIESLLRGTNKSLQTAMNLLAKINADTALELVDYKIIPYQGSSTQDKFSSLSVVLKIYNPDNVPEDSGWVDTSCRVNHVQHVLNSQLYALKEVARLLSGEKYIHVLSIHAAGEPIPLLFKKSFATVTISMSAYGNPTDGLIE